MKKVINNKVYDTDTATYLAWWENQFHPGDFDWKREELYRKKTGEYFLHGEGGAMSEYARPADSSSGNWVQGGQKIVLLTYEQANEWAKNHLDTEEYMELFGIKDDNEEIESTYIRINLSVNDRKKLDRIRANTLETYSEVVSRAIDKLEK